MKTKPKMKANQFCESPEIPVKVSLDCDMERFQNGFLHMAITSVKVKQNGEPLGDVTVNVQGSAVHMHFSGSKRTWSISIQELVPLFLEADARYARKS